MGHANICFYKENTDKSRTFCLCIGYPATIDWQSVLLCVGKDSQNSYGYESNRGEKVKIKEREGIRMKERQVNYLQILRIGLGLLSGGM